MLKTIILLNLIVCGTLLSYYSKAYFHVYLVMLGHFFNNKDLASKIHDLVCIGNIFMHFQSNAHHLKQGSGNLFGQMSYKGYISLFTIL